MSTYSYNGNVTIIGAGIAGISATLELLDAGKSVILLDRDKPERFGGLAKESFGGMFFVNSPQQKRTGIKDDTELALSDWKSFAQFDKEEDWGVKWAEKFVNSTNEVYKWVSKYKIKFFPVIHWVERGLFYRGNSVPRFHMVWGTGYEIINRLEQALENHKNKNKLTILFEHKVEDFLHENGKIIGVIGTNEKDGNKFQVSSDSTIIASGGINGDLKKVKRNWHTGEQNAPENILNGSHHFSNGLLHKAAEKINANITNLEKMWNYAAGIPHPNPLRPNHGLSIVPPKSALWVNPTGERYKPYPLVTAFDTKYMVDKICEEKHKYSWQVMNKKIAYNELAVSGSDFNDGIKNKNILQFLRDLLFGNKKLIKTLEEKSDNYITANSIEELVEKMYNFEKNHHLDKEKLVKTIKDYDDNISRGKKFYNDIQLRLITHARQYRGDRVRTCKYQKIDDKKAYPLIAIKENILSRKSLGGIQTDLSSRVLMKPINGKQEHIKGLYAAGEASGFGGGGSHGQRALEGTFLATCILTAKTAAEDIIKNNN